MTGSRYDDYPDHPLHGVPEDVLAAARTALREAADLEGWTTLYESRDDARVVINTVADSVVMSVLQEMRRDDGGRDT